MKDFLFFSVATDKTSVSLKVQNLIFFRFIFSRPKYVAHGNGTSKALCGLPCFNRLVHVTRVPVSCKFCKVSLRIIEC